MAYAVPTGASKRLTNGGDPVDVQRGDTLQMQIIPHEHGHKPQYIQGEVTKTPAGTEVQVSCKIRKLKSKQQGDADLRNEELTLADGSRFRIVQVRASVGRR